MSDDSVDWLSTSDKRHRVSYILFAAFEVAIGTTDADGAGARFSLWAVSLVDAECVIYGSIPDHARETDLLIPADSY
jgi:hypothetical protein